MKRSTSHSRRDVAAGFLAFSLVFSSGLFSTASGIDLEGDRSVAGVGVPATFDPVEGGVEEPGTGDPVESGVETPGIGDPGGEVPGGGDLGGSDGESEEGPPESGGSEEPEPAPEPSVPVEVPETSGKSARVPGPGAHRVSGANRYATAVSLSTFTYPDGADTVIVASGTAFPDGLAAAPLAAKLQGPLLLTPASRLDAGVASEIRRLGPARVIVVGGTGAVSAATFKELGALTKGVTRLGGANRYETAQKIAQFGWPKGSSDIVIATGAQYADALSASPVASILDAPLLLVPREKGAMLVHAQTEVRKSGATTIHIAGGTGAVSNAVVSELVKSTSAKSVRYGGGDRYETSALLIKAHFTTGTPAIYWASGQNFPDAIAGAGAAGATKSALALSKQQCVPQGVSEQSKRLGATSSVTLGGAAVLSDYVLKGLECFANSPAPAISGTAKVGSTLTASIRSWSPQPSSFSYQWYRGGSAIPSATSPTYKLAKADGGKGVSVRVTGRLDGFAPTTVASKAVTVFDPASVTDPNSTLVLVNKKNPLKPLRFAPSDLYYPSVPNSNNQPMKHVAGKALEKMVAGARSAGHSLYLMSGYRSYTTQQYLFDSYVRSSGRAAAETFSARPGYSEHQTGLAADIYAYGYCQGSCFGGTAPGQWLRNNAYKYGYILRYDQGKQHIVGYIYEPWHFRYVGVEVATNMRNRGITTLEQYLGYPAAPTY